MSVMAGELDATSKHWHSSDRAIKYREMAKRFHLLGQINTLFSNAFNQKLEQLKAAYRESLCQGMSHLPLRWREALEYGYVQFFRLKMRGSGPGDPSTVGRYGVLVYVSYYSDSAFYEFFPRRLLIRKRADLDYTQLLHAVDTVTNQPWMRFDWPAYAFGSEPAEWAQTSAITDLLIDNLGHELDEIADPPPLDAAGRRVPRTFDSPRSHALANVILEQHMLLDSLALQAKAKQPLTLQEAVSGSAPWADYLRNAALEPD